MDEHSMQIDQIEDGHVVLAVPSLRLIVKRRTLEEARVGQICDRVPKPTRGSDGMVLLLGRSAVPDNAPAMTSRGRPQQKADRPIRREHPIAE